MRRPVGAEKEWEGSESVECRWKRDYSQHTALDQVSASAVRVELLVLVAAMFLCSLLLAVLMVLLD